MPKLIRNMYDVLEAFRDGAGPDVTLRMDLNFSQRTEGFIRIANALEDLNLAWLECDIHDPEALALLRRSTTTPIASLETIHGLQAFKPFLAKLLLRRRHRRRAVERHVGIGAHRLAVRRVRGRLRAAQFRGASVELYQRAFLRRRSRTIASWNTTSTRCRGATTCSLTRQ